MDVTQERSTESALKDLGKMLVEARLITEEQLANINDLQSKSGDKIERILLQERLITPQQLAFFSSSSSIPSFSITFLAEISYAFSRSGVTQPGK